MTNEPAKGNNFKSSKRVYAYIICNILTCLAIFNKCFHNYHLHVHSVLMKCTNGVFSCFVILIIIGDIFFFSKSKYIEAYIH